MPEPVVDPTPLPSSECRESVPLDEQEASYLAASARMASLDCNLMGTAGMAACAASADLVEMIVRVSLLLIYTVYKYTVVMAISNVLAANQG